MLSERPFDSLRDVHPHHVGEARPRDRQVATVARGEHVVDVLVVALARTLLDREVERQLLRVGPDVGELLLLVGDQVHAPLEHLEPCARPRSSRCRPSCCPPTSRRGATLSGRGRCRGALGRSGRRTAPVSSVTGSASRARRAVRRMPGSTTEHAGRHARRPPPDRRDGVDDGVSDAEGPAHPRRLQRRPGRPRSSGPSRPSAHARRAVSCAAVRPHSSRQRETGRHCLQ